MPPTQRRKVIKHRMLSYRKRGINEPTVTMVTFQTKAGSFVQNHGRRVEVTTHSTGSSYSGFRLRQSAPTLSRPRMARNKNQYACGCNWRLAIGRSSSAESPCRSTAPIQTNDATVSRISVYIISGNRKMCGSLVRILRFWCVCSRAAWQVTSCGLASVSFGS